MNSYGTLKIFKVERSTEHYIYSFLNFDLNGENKNIYSHLFELCLKKFQTYIQETVTQK